ncbi:acetyl-coenzyme A synthetase 2-like, mitochondrial isoform X2 [Heptranchias perlo]|uniref:acetyl-coenzyme A synthetase 2-like, mitochondrial isoform X2 n=1 Tax=Heptranchias perlo TaxID=212740 RepID=UPI00355A76E7
MGGIRLLQVPFKRCLLPGAYVNKRTAARARVSARSMYRQQMRPFHPTPSAPNISSFLPESSSFPGVRSYADLLDFSISDPEKFWGTLAKERLVWNQLFHRVHDCDFSRGSIAWFLGGQLNVSVNCLDRHVNQSPNRVALIWERDEPGTELRITYRELLETTCRLANTLKRHGVQKGDKVAIYLPVSPLGVAAMLACTRIGAVHTVVFAGFSSQALGGRIRDAQCKAVITCNQGVRSGRVTELKRTVDEAIKACPTVKHVFVVQRTDKKVPMSDIDILLEEEMEKEQPVCDPEPMDSEDMLFLLYTSGSTGKPKGLVHTQAGYLLYASLTHKYVFDYQEGDIHCCVADIGWITGHSYVVYGPLCNGGTTVLFESTPLYPDPVGEPINHEAWQWYWKVVGEGRCTVVDTWWQTETGGICISPRPSKEGAKIVPSMAMRPFFGIQPALMDEKGDRVEGNDVFGALCITRPWPGIARTIYGDHPRFLKAYFKTYPGCYFTGDGAYRSGEGYYQITGRMDDIINISGHRLGTAEVENALAKHPDVSETAVIGYPHNLKGEAAFAFVILKDISTISEPVIVKDLKSIVASEIAKYAVPGRILIVKRLPKTRSGKIMRRLLKKIATDDTSNLGDLTTLDDPSVIREITAAYEKYKKDSATSQ